MYLYMYTYDYVYISIYTKLCVYIYIYIIYHHISTWVSKHETWRYHRELIRRRNKLTWLDANLVPERNSSGMGDIL